MKTPGLLLHGRQAATLKAEAAFLIAMILLVVGARTIRCKTQAFDAAILLQRTEMGKHLRFVFS